MIWEAWFSDDLRFRIPVDLLPRLTVSVLLIPSIWPFANS